MSTDSNTGKLDHNPVEHETNEPIGSNSLLALLHSRYCEMHATPSVGPFGSLS